MDALVRKRRLALLAGVLAVVGVGVLAGPGLAGLQRQGPAATQRLMERANHADRAGSSDREAEGDEVIDGNAQYQAMRVAPAAVVSGAAMVAGETAASQLPVSGGTWGELTNVPYFSDATDFRDPNISNSGGGAAYVTGRATALAVDPANPDIVYAGFADGGVWVTTDAGTHWAALTDQLASLSVGALAIDPTDGSLWVATGEGNTNFDGYLGVGVLRCAAPCRAGSTFAPVGGDELQGTVATRLTFSDDGQVYVATSKGLFARPASDLVSPWTLRLDATMVGGTPRPYGMSIVNDVKVKPGTGGQDVIASMAWRNGADYDGWYESTDGGATFHKVTPTGAVDASDLGRTTFAYSADGSRLYAVVQSPRKMFNPHFVSVLQGVYRSDSGSLAGPWVLIADRQELDNGSPLHFQRGYKPGIQAWYNQFLIVDPANADHVYLGLEEIYETRDAGANWHDIGKYWNFNTTCFSPGPDNTCPTTTHADQHAVAIGGGLVYIGSDGGVWSRSLTQSMKTTAGWNDLNIGLDTLQYYAAGAGHSSRARHGHAAGDQIWGGLQDNGDSMLVPGSPPMVSPFGGDGGDVIVDPNDGERVVAEYTSLDMWKTENGGYSPFGTRIGWREITPSCFAFTYTPSPCDPLPRFIAPFTADVHNLDHWVAGGRYVWDNQGKGWRTSCSSTSCDWKIVWDTMTGSGGQPRSVTALAVSGDTTWAAWCAPGTGCNPSELSDPPVDDSGFASGVDTSYDPTGAYASTGGWHHLDSAALGLPNRYINSIAVDPANPAHAYLVFGGFSRRWIPADLNPGVGHVYETTDGGLSFHDVSGDLPDVPADDLLLTPDGTLVLATDLGVYVAPAADPSHWTRLGEGLPNASVNDLAWGPDGSYIIAATHGRGLWSIATP